MKFIYFFLILLIISLKIKVTYYEHYKIIRFKFDL